MHMHAKIEHWLKRVTTNYPLRQQSVASTRLIGHVQTARQSYAQAEPRLHVVTKTCRQLNGKMALLLGTCT